MSRKVLLAIMLVAGTMGVHAQDSGNASAFEIASIKVATLGSGLGGSQSSPDRYTQPNASLRDLITDAYHLQRFEVVGGPEWITGSVRFDVNAKASFVPSAEQRRVMVQRLLAERFALRTHKEIREMPVYVLHMARKEGRLGEQLKRTPVDCAAIRAERIRKGESGSRRSSAPDDRPLCDTFLTARPFSGRMTLRYQASGITSGDFAEWLSPYLRRPVVDRTTLTGDFDLDLAFAPGDVDVSTAPADDAISIFTAIEEQLGLKLESDRAPVEVLVIDGAKLPTPD